MICYTDGACLPNPGVGGWAFILIDPSGEMRAKRSGSHPSTTNNRMEYTAFIKALEEFGEILDEVRTDSMLLVDTSTKWRHSWKRKNWTKGKKKDEIKNVDLVQRIDELLSLHKKVKVTWVRGHDGDKYNEMVDTLAGEAAIKATKVTQNPNDADQAQRQESRTGVF